MASVGSSSGEIAQQVQAKLFDDVYAYSGETLRIKKGIGIDPEKVEGFLEFHKNSELAKDETLLRGDILEPFIQSQIDRGSWYTNGDETGARFYIEGVPAVRLVDGVLEPVEFLYDDIQASNFRLQFNEVLGFSEPVIGGEVLDVEFDTELTGEI